MGYSGDIKKLINFEVSDLYVNRGLVANAQFFSEPFFRNFHIFRDYFRITNFQPLISDIPKYIESNNSEFPIFFKRLYTQYLGVMALYFNIQSPLNLKLAPLATNDKVEFKDFFVNSHDGYVVNTDLGTTIESYKILNKYFKQSISDVQNQSTKDSLTYIKSKQFIGNSITNAEFKDLQNWSNTRSDFSKKWLRTVTNNIEPQKTVLDKQPFKVYFPGIKGDSQNDLWLSLQKTSDIYNFMFDTWLKNTPNVEHTPFYLLGGAKDGKLNELIIMSRLVRSHKISGQELEEAKRIIQHHVYFRMKHKKFNARFSLVLFNYYFYNKETGTNLKNIDNYLKDIFNNYFPNYCDKLMSSIDDKQTLIEIFNDIYKKNSNDGYKIRIRRGLEAGFEITHDINFFNQLKLDMDNKEIQEPLYNYSINNNLFL